MWTPSTSDAMFVQVLLGCMTTIVLLITSVGFFGYLAFGSTVKEIVLKSLPQVRRPSPTACLAARR